MWPFHLKRGSPTMGLVLGCSHDQVASLSQFADGNLTWRCDALAVGNAQQLLAHPDVSQAHQQGLDVALRFGSDIVRHWVQVPSKQARSMTELRAMSQVRCVQLFGGQISDWHVLADWHTSNPFVCAAIPLSWHSIIQSLPRRWRIDSLFMLAMRRCSKQLPPNGWVVVLVAMELHLLKIQRRYVVHLRTLSTPCFSDPLQTRAWSCAQLHQELLRFSGPIEKMVGMDLRGKSTRKHAPSVQDVHAMEGMQAGMLLPELQWLGVIPTVIDSVKLTPALLASTLPAMDQSAQAAMGAAFAATWIKEMGGS